MNVIKDEFKTYNTRTVHTLKTVQKIPVSLQQAWNFFSHPGNLAMITPPYLKFKIITPDTGDTVYPGQIIEYRVSPLWGIAVGWKTEIGQVQYPQYFTDKQLKGPYSFWLHAHHFREIEGGVEMTDVVQYKNPLGPLGKLANMLFVRRQLKKIFEYRFKKIETILGTWEGQTYCIETG